MTRKRWIYLIVIAVGVAAGVLAVVLPREREPEYGGRKLSEWLMVWARSDVHEDGLKPREEARAAFRHIGTNGIPYLLEWIRYEPPFWRKKLFVVKHPLLRRLDRIFPVTDFRALVRGEAATYALTTLGAEAEEAVGELGDLLKKEGNSWVPARAASALAHLGAAGRAQLLMALTNGQASPWGRCSAINELEKMGTNARFAIPVLQVALGDGDWSVRQQATNALREVNGSRPDGDPYE